MRVSLVLLVLVPQMLIGQVPSQIVLKPAIAALSAEFGTVRSIRELADGRVLIADNGPESRLAIANFRVDSVTTLGRHGNGPGEYQNIGRLYPLSHDSTLFTDDGRSGRWVLLASDRIAGTVPPDLPALRVTGAAIGADSAGHVLGRRQVSGGGRRIDPILLADRRHAGVDTALQLYAATFSARNGGTASKPFMVVEQLTYSTPEQALLFLDGWIAAVRLDPYRVEWRAPDGRITRGPALPWTPVKVDAREKAAYLDRYFKRYGRRMAEDQYGWAETVSPISGIMVLAAPGGNVVIPRSQWSGSPETRYDVVDRRGTLVGRVDLAVNERIVGFGPASVYVVAVDDDGIERLRKHPWP